MQPTFERGPAFAKDFSALTPENRERFRVAVRQLVEDLKAGRQPRPGLRVKRVKGVPRVWELAWAPDGRATYTYGAELIPGEPHVQWRRIGTHDIFKDASTGRLAPAPATGDGTLSHVMVDRPGRNRSRARRRFG